MGRPSPRTQGIDEEGLPFQKFGTQQLVKDPLSPTGVKQIDTGKPFKGFTTSGYTGTKTTVFSERFQAGITGAVPVELHDEAVRRQKEKLEEMGIPQIQFPDLTKLFPPASPNGETCTDCDSDKCVECNAWDVGCELGHMFAGTCTPPEKPPDEECDLGCLVTGRGCDCGCKDMKPCTTCDSDVCKECNAWDLQCEDCHKKNGTCTPPPEEKTMLFWAKIVAVVIGIGVFLWLLRPLFSRGGSKPTGGFTITPA